MNSHHPTAVSLVSDGSWSGGGSAFLNNAREAALRYPVLNGGRDDVPLIARNTPTPTGSVQGPFVLVPQNAWPWRLAGATRKELTKLLPMRAASERTMRSRLGLLRISSAIPALGNPDTISPVIHNVLDSGYETALATSSDLAISEAVGAIVSIGSMHSYRNMINVVRAHTEFVRQGGDTPLFLAGAPGDPQVLDALKRMIANQGTDLIRFRTTPLTRPECLAAFRDAQLVVQASLVEASPFAALEALSVNNRVVLSNIVGNRGILLNAEARAGAQHTGWFPPRSPQSLADAMINSAELPVSPLTPILASRDFRQAQRIAWGDRVANWVESILPTRNC